jgi:hypothetical protein
MDSLTIQAAPLDTHPEIAVWRDTDWRSLWMLDKLILARSLGYTCGPAGQPVPAPGKYVVRPCVNAKGMGEGARIEYIERDTDHLPAGTFWCEGLEGPHLSVDYERRPFIGLAPVLCVMGFRAPDAPLWKWQFWMRISESSAPPLPEHVEEAVPPGTTINAEFVGGKLIEVHFRRNTDFDNGVNIYMPVWSDDDFDPINPPMSRLQWRDDPDGQRIGAWVA